MVTFTIICFALALFLTLKMVATSMKTASEATNARTKGAAQRRVIDGLGRCMTYILAILRTAK